MHYFNWLLSAPELEDAEQASLAKMLHTVLLLLFFVFLSGSALFVVWLGAFRNKWDFISISILVGALLVDGWLLTSLKYGRIRLASRVLVGGFYIITTLSILFYGGIYDVSIVGYFFLITVASLFLGHRAAMVSTILSVLTLIGIYFIQVSGLLHFAHNDDPIFRLIGLVGGLGMVNLIVNLSLQRFERSLDKTKLETAGRQTAEEHFLTMVETAVDGVIISNRQGRIVNVNRQVEIIFGYARQEILGEPIELLIPEKYRSEHPQLREEFWSQPLSQRMGSGMETVGLRKDGAQVPLDISLNPLGSSNDLVVSFLRDITARKENEHSLIHQAKELELMHVARTAISRQVDLSGIFHTYVEALADIFNYSLVNLYLLDNGRLRLEHQIGFEEIFDQLSVEQGVLGRVARTGKPDLIKDVSTDPDFIAPIDGIVSEVCVPLFDADRVVGVLNVETLEKGVLSERDLDLMVELSKYVGFAIERVRIYNDLATSENLYRALFEFSPDGIILYNGIVIEYINPAGLKLLGASTEEQVVGKTALDFVYPDDHQLVQKRYQKLQRGETLELQVIRVVRLDGKVIHVEVCSKPIEIEGHKMNLAILRDITLRVQREGEMQVIAAISETLRLPGAPAELIPEILDQIIELMGATGAALGLFDEAKGKITFRACRGVWGDASETSLSPQEGITGMVFTTGESYINSDVQAEPRETFVYPQMVYRAHAVACIPLISPEKTVGVLWIGKDSAISEQDLRAMNAISDIASSAIHHAYLQEEIETDFINTVLALAKALDARDSLTANHSERLSLWAEVTLKAMGGSQEELETIRLTALLHDIGKVGIPDEILRKPGKLTKEEVEIMQKHPEIGAEIVAPIRKLANVAPIIRAHHEKYDGSGYPYGLKSSQIPLAARIMAVVDAYTAMTEDRPYRPARINQEAIEELKRCAGADFDPQVVNTFLTELDKLEED